MQLKLTVKNVITFIALTFIMGEAHELAHTGIGRVMCGCWGARDFNGWGLCGDCYDERFPFSTITTFAGPIFTFIMGWIGYFLLDKSKSISQKSLGFALVFANMPFARLFTAAFQSGDEVYALGLLTKNWDLSWAVGFFTIAIITFPPLYRAYKTIGNKRKLAWFLLFFIAPMIISFLVVLGLLNTLLANGILSNTGILGSPIIINVWTAIILIVFFLLRKNIYTLFESSQE